MSLVIPVYANILYMYVVNTVMVQSWYSTAAGIGWVARGGEGVRG